MKRTHIIALVFVAVLVASLTVMLGKGFSRYESFDSSYAKKGKEFTVVGYLNKEKGIEYKPEINPNQFSMYVIDEQKVEGQVVVNKARTPDADSRSPCITHGLLCYRPFLPLVRRRPGCCAALRFPVLLRCGSLLRLHAARSS